MVVVRRSLLILVSGLLVWRIASNGVSSHYVELLEDGEEQAAQKALVWNANQPEALYRKALSLWEADPDNATQLLARAYSENPADARPLLAVADIYQAQGNPSRADALINLAVELRPADPLVHNRVANYWILRGDLQKAMEHWSLTLETDPSAQKRLFPALLTLAEDPPARPAFRPFAQSPPTWWNAFFAEVSKNASDVETVRQLYALRLESSRGPISEPERKNYVARLKKEGLISEAYVRWTNGLSSEQRAHLGWLYDGGFELEPTNWGFDWHLRGTRGVLIDRARTYGVHGEKALHLLFEHNRARFQGISQPLFLDPGSYRLSGKIRTDSLETKGGLKWVIGCKHLETKELGESERFLGTNQWRSFSFDFKVPDSCSLQEIRLVSSGKQTFEHELTGGAWFDQMSIRKVSAEIGPADAVPREDSDASSAATKTGSGEDKEGASEKADSG